MTHLTSLQPYSNHLVSDIPYTPTGRYASIILLRETKSYGIFTTEGGEQQDVERTQAGLQDANPISRLVMFKRKQVAAERRTGKALLRQYVMPYAHAVKKEKKIETLLKFAAGKADVAALQKEFAASKGVTVDPIRDCYLTEGLCTHCPDCLIYGYAAVEGEGARKSRLLTDSCFSVRPYPLIQRRMNFNVISEKTQTSGTITQFDYTVPSVFLPSVVTTVDLTADELAYVLSNILRTARYGKGSTRQGSMKNHVLGIAFSDVELFSNLEFTQAYYDAFQADDEIDMATGFLSAQTFLKHTPQVLEQLTGDVFGRMQLLQNDQLTPLLDEIRQLNQDEKALASFLQQLTQQSASFVL